MACVQQPETTTAPEPESSIEGIDTTIQDSADKTEDIDLSKDICQFYVKGTCRFGEKCKYFHPEITHEKQVTKQKKGCKPKKKKPEEDVIVAKKPPLKTAGDVRHRIIWDAAVPQQYFSVGYVDRFAGLVEKPFSTFVWGDLCDAGPEDLAVPQHCISYFKYKGVKVWDKTIRLDHVFGSAGNTMKIEEKIIEIEAELKKESRELNPDDDDSDDDFYCDIVVTGNTGLHIKAACKASYDEQLRASHFICIKINESMVKEEIFKVQESIYYLDPTLRSCVMPRELLHITLAMVRCDSDEAIESVKTLLNSLQVKLSENVDADETSQDSKSQRTIVASGLSTFGARVLYAKLQIPDSFMTAVDILHEGIRKLDGAQITNNFEFIPHMTLVKVNRPTQMERRSKYMNSSLYDTYLDHTFGIINFNNIHFCPIDNNRSSDGFYQTLTHIEF